MKSFHFRNIPKKHQKERRCWEPKDERKMWEIGEKKFQRTKLIPSVQPFCKSWAIPF